MLYMVSPFRFTINLSINQSFICSQYIKQWNNMSIKTRRAGQQGTRCTYGCPYKTQKISKTDVKQVQMSEMKTIKWPTSTITPRLRQLLPLDYRANCLDHVEKFDDDDDEVDYYYLVVYVRIPGRQSTQSLLRQSALLHRAAAFIAALPHSNPCGIRLSSRVKLDGIVRNRRGRGWSCCCCWNKNCRY